LEISLERLESARADLQVMIEFRVVLGSALAFPTVVVLF
jgi:hypothetical protein